MRTAIIAAAASALILAGCGASTASVGDSTKPLTPAALAAKLHGCHGFELSKTKVYYTAASGDCTGADGENVNIAVYASNDERDAAVKVAGVFGVGYSVTGDRWTVMTITRKDAESAQHDLGGDLSKLGT